MKFCIRVFLLIFFIPIWSYGLGFRLINQDAEAIGRGNAFAATANNPSAIYYNPAGITQLEGQNFQLGLYSIAVQSKYTSFDHSSADTTGDLQSIPNFHYVYTPKSSPFSFGLGLYAPYGLDLEWPENSGFRTIVTEAKLQYITLNPVIAYQVTRNFSIGAGPTINYAKLGFERGIFIPSSSINNPLNSLFGLPETDEFEVEGDAIAFGFNVGLLWQPIKQISLGMTYRSPTTMDFHGNSEANPYTPSEASTVGGFDFPQHVVWGVSYRPTPEWNLEFNLDWTDWNTLNTLVVQKDSGDVKLPLNWDSSFIYEFGVSRYFSNGLTLSAGYLYSENSVPNQNFNPAIPDTNIHVFSLGIGYKYKNWSYNLSTQYGSTLSDRAVNDSITTSLAGETADGKYRYDYHAFALSVGYHF